MSASPERAPLEEGKPSRGGTAEAAAFAAVRFIGGDTDVAGEHEGVLEVAAMAAGVEMANLAKSETWSDGYCFAGRKPSARTMSSEGSTSTCRGVRPGDAKM